MKKPIVYLLLSLIIFAAAANTQETYFGKNKVRYKHFEWKYIKSSHFDIYFYEDAIETAKFTATVMESSYVEISNELNYRLSEPVPIFVYNSHNDFQQTNIISSLIPEGVGGFTEAFKNRVVIPFNGSYEEFRHVLHHELTHAVIYDMLYGKNFGSMLSKRRLFNLPLWFAEGYAEYSSRHGWDYFSDMFVRDATINNYLQPPMYMSGFLAYKEGQALVKYIAETYGEDRLGKILKKGKVVLTMNRALKEVVGKTEKEIWEDFSKEMKRRYWPEIALRQEAKEMGKQLTKARKDGSYFNEKPVYHPDGTKLAIFTDKSDYTELVLISARTGKHIKKLVKSSRSGDLESLHSYVSGATFSPDGSKIAFVAKSNGLSTIMFYDLDKGDIYLKKSFDFHNIVSPVWSPDGNKIAFSALKAHERDIYVYDIESDKHERITSDFYDDVDPSWIPNTNKLLFTSDRKHPNTQVPDSKTHMYVTEGAHIPGDFVYGFYNLFTVNLGSKEIKPLDVGPGQNKRGTVSPDGKKVAFISNRNGIDNIYIAYLKNGKNYPVTDILTGIFSIDWSPDGESIAFSAFSNGAFDIFILEELVAFGEKGMLANTGYIEGKYDLLRNGDESDELALVENDSTVIKDSTLSNDYTFYEVDSTMMAGLSDTTDTVEDTVEIAVETDTVITETGIYDEGYVFVSEDNIDRIDSLLMDIPRESDGGFDKISVKEKKIFETRQELDDEGEYKVHKYKSKLSADYVGGGFGYDTFFGLQGRTAFVFTDYLGNNMVYIATDLVNTFDQSNLQAFYFYNRNRTNYGIGGLHTKNFYEDSNGFLFSDRFYGIQTLISRPFSTYSRLELISSQYFIDRQYYDFDDPRRINGDRNSKVTTAEFSYITDNILWGFTGPVNGRRTKITISAGVNLFDTDDIESYAVDFDFRKYWHYKKSFSFALRASGGASFGRTPKIYFLGGTTNWIGTRTLDAKVYEVENLYFSDVVTPLRGFPYYELSGDRYGLINAEFRFPLIDYFIMRFPLAIALQQVKGVAFADIGAAWNGSDFKGGTSSDGGHLQDIKMGFGFGMRLNLGFLLLRYDLAWNTDFQDVSAHPTSYFSFGADF